MVGWYCGGFSSKACNHKIERRETQVEQERKRERECVESERRERENDKKIIQLFCYTSLFNSHNCSFKYIFEDYFLKINIFSY